MDRRVPSGISFLPMGTMTVKVFPFPFRNFAWLPRCDTKIKPLRSKTRATVSEEQSLGINELHWNYLWLLDGSVFRGLVFLEIQLQCLFNIGECFLLGLAEAGNVHIKTLRNEEFLLLPEDDVELLLLHTLIVCLL